MRSPPVFRHWQAAGNFFQCRTAYIAAIQPLVMDFGRYSPGLKKAVQHAFSGSLSGQKYCGEGRRAGLLITPGLVPACHGNKKMARATPWPFGNKRRYI
jgi:hypothetical protein